MASGKKYLVLAEGKSGDPHYGKTMRGVVRYAADPVHQAVVAEHVRPFLATRSAVQYRF